MQTAILLAGGKGRRMGPSIPDKLLHPIGSSNAFRMSCEAFLESSSICSFIIVFRNAKQKQVLQKEFQLACKKTRKEAEPLWVQGGKERKNSVFNAIRACDESCKFVHVHDCARPMIRPNTIDELALLVSESGAVAVARPLADSLKRCFPTSADSLPNLKFESIERNNLWLMETPQVMKRDWLVEGLRKAEELEVEVTDEFAALELTKRKASFFDPGYPNPKITKTSDLAYIEFQLKQ